MKPVGAGVRNPVEAAPEPPDLCVEPEHTEERERPQPVEPGELGQPVLRVFVRHRSAHGSPPRLTVVE